MNDHATYNYKVVRPFSIMSMVWGIIGMPIGVISGGFYLAWR